MKKSNKIKSVRINHNGITTFFGTTKGNEKTGTGYITTHFIEDISPIESRKQGLDSTTVCKGCAYANGNGCYTNPLFLSSIHKGRSKYFLAQDWAEFSSISAHLARNEYVRFGNFGNPSLLPIQVIENIANSASVYTGYIADWREQVPEYSRYFMASTQSLQATKEANDLGYRAFLSIPEDKVAETLEKARKENVKLVQCINEQNNMITCKQCGLCDGTKNGKKSNIYITIHGFQRKKAEKAFSA